MVFLEGMALGFGGIGKSGSAAFARDAAAIKLRRGCVGYELKLASPRRKQNAGLAPELGRVGADDDAGRALEKCALEIGNLGVAGEDAALRDAFRAEECNVEFPMPGRGASALAKQDRLALQETASLPVS